MYGAMREHAPQSTRLAGAITAATATLAFGYAMANGMGAYIAQHVPEALIYVPLPDKPIVDLPTNAKELSTSTESLPIVKPLVLIDTFIPEETVIGEVQPETRPGKTIGAIPTPPTPPAPIRTAAKMISASSPHYPPADVRGDHEGISALEVCLDTGGRVTSAILASSSGYASLDQAALKWVRDRKFTPAKLDGRPQPVCGHPVVYEWRLDRR